MQKYHQETFRQYVSCWLMDQMKTFWTVTMTLLPHIHLVHMWCVHWYTCEGQRLTLSSSHFPVSHTWGIKCGGGQRICRLAVLFCHIMCSGSLSFKDMFTHPKPWCGWFTLLKHTDSQTCRQVSFGDPTSSLRISGQVFYQLSFTDHPSPLFLFLFLFCTRLWRGTNHTTVDFL